MRISQVQFYHLFYNVFYHETQIKHLLETTLKNQDYITTLTFYYYFSIKELVLRNIFSLERHMDAIILTCTISNCNHYLIFLNFGL
jgi:hypothetical protein